MDPSNSSFNVGQNRPDNSVASFDVDLLDCSICFDPFKFLITQCENGHTTCSSCSNRLEKCPYCELPIGVMRNFAFEKLIESVEFYCRYKDNGCTEIISHDNKIHHEIICSFVDCSCPISNCDVIGSSDSIYDHCKMVHNNSVTIFDFDSIFVVSLNLKSESFVVLQENNTNAVFILNNLSESFGNVLSLCRLGPSSSSRCHYAIEIRVGQSSIKFESSVDNIQSVEAYNGSTFGLPLDIKNIFVSDCYTILHLTVSPDAAMILEDDSDEEM
ncbi:putative E3 ubiquitin-protein ligase SINA-like 6 [Mercurialis annua]|uniref:putative E3 ubiquitin-protein ligase SINA-like 6 n=1 Tax=Mercurialis annua TaxID=3986 RepID=UPI002160DDF5|nr:putative E3 ubiquitin-protein ligase SINA-like 6 [Mercurialis annua]